MNLQRTINAWTCLPAAFSTCFYNEFGDIWSVFTALGHDGSEVVREGSDPSCRRGFHPQEMIALAATLNYSVTQIDHRPAAQPKLGSKFCYFPTILGEDCEDRFLRNLQESFGWIDCRTRRGTGHALAYDHATIGDPATGETFTYQSRQDAESRGLYFVSLFRLDYMESSA